MYKRGKLLLLLLIKKTDIFVKKFIKNKLNIIKRWRFSSLIIKKLSIWLAASKQVFLKQLRFLKLLFKIKSNWRNLQFKGFFRMNYELNYL